MSRALKIQGTIRGYSAWVVEQLMELKGESLSDMTKQIFDRWIEDNSEFLERRYKLTLDAYREAEARREGAIVEFDQQDAR